MKADDRVTFLEGKHAGEMWFVNHIEVAYWDDENGVRHASYDVSVVPNKGDYVAFYAEYDNLKVVDVEVF